LTALRMWYFFSKVRNNSKMVHNSATKKCNNCKVEKPLASFCMRKNGQAYSCCKPCKLLRARDSYKKRREKNGLKGRRKSVIGNLKQCLTCERMLPFGMYGRNGKYMQSNCLDCKNAWKMNAYKRAKKFRDDYLADKSCVASGCTISDNMLLEFDHLGDKTANICDLISRNNRCKTSRVR